ncbi:uncharacterized protein LOC143682535 isoform X2 [Tamandua tetradactyla]|uniref:uncharacterized protein LOC143682535 isoform X2 n=1 Tax=Tamandua tetradactyla TaxID=48850 RepID=UPI004053C507
MTENEGQGEGEVRKQFPQARADPSRIPVAPEAAIQWGGEGIRLRLRSLHLDRHVSSRRSSAPEAGAALQPSRHQRRFLVFTSAAGTAGAVGRPEVAILRHPLTPSRRQHRPALLAFIQQVASLRPQEDGVCGRGGVCGEGQRVGLGSACISF